MVGVCTKHLRMQYTHVEVFFFRFILIRDLVRGNRAQYAHIENTALIYRKDTVYRDEHAYRRFRKDG